MLYFAVGLGQEVSGVSGAGSATRNTAAPYIALLFSQPPIGRRLEDRKVLVRREDSEKEG